MFKNYGDRNFLEYGVLVDDEHEEDEIRVLYCLPLEELNSYTGEQQYLFAAVVVCIDDEWIDREDVMTFIGMTNESYDEIQFAIGCVEFYGIEEFSGGQTYVYNADEIKKELNGYLIAWDNLVVEE